MAQKITSFTQLNTWQSSRQFAVIIYKISKKFPKAEIFGLSSQIKRSSVSVSANIAEGFSRSGRKDKIHFYHIAMGSLTETLSHAYIAFDLGFIDKTDIQYIEEQFTNIQKMLFGLIKSVKGL
jgi:four helix bundle protein